MISKHLKFNFVRNPEYLVSESNIKTHLLHFLAVMLDADQLLNQFSKQGKAGHDVGESSPFHT